MTTSISWPPTVNYYIERGSFKLSPSDDNLRTDFDKGPARVRRRFTVAIPKFEFNITMEEYDLQVFKSFYLNNLYNGVNWFIMPLWDGSSYTDHVCRFTEPYSLVDFSYGQTTVSFKIEARELTVLSDYVSYVLGQYGVELADRIQSLLNIDYFRVTEDYLDMPTNLTPAFFATRNTNQVIPNSTVTKILCDVQVFDSSNFYDTTNGRFTPLVAGYYNISISANFLDAGSAPQGGNLSIYKNGSYSFSIGDSQFDNGSANLSGNTLVYFNGTTDYVEMFATISGTGANTIADPRFSGFYVSS